MLGCWAVTYSEGEFQAEFHPRRLGGGQLRGIRRGMRREGEEYVQCDRLQVGEEEGGPEGEDGSERHCAGEDVRWMAAREDVRWVIMGSGGVRMYR